MFFHEKCFKQVFFEIFIFVVYFFSLGKATMENSVLCPTPFHLLPNFLLQKCNMIIKHGSHSPHCFFADIIFHTMHFDLEKVETTKQIEQSETRP